MKSPVISTVVTLGAIIIGAAVGFMSSRSQGRQKDDPYTAGCAALDEERYDEAITHFSEAIDANPKHAEAFRDRGEAYGYKKDFDRAIDDFNRAIELNPRDAVAFHDRGYTYEQMREYVKAIADYSEAIRLDPKDEWSAWSYNSLAWIWATCPNDQLRDGKRALEYATKACDLSHWAEPDALDTLAAAYVECGQFNEAIKWASKALEISKDNELSSDIRAALEGYRQGKPNRTKETAEQGSLAKP